MEMEMGKWGKCGNGVRRNGVRRKWGQDPLIVESGWKWVEMGSGPIDCRKCAQCSRDPLTRFSQNLVQSCTKRKKARANAQRIAHTFKWVLTPFSHFHFHHFHFIDPILSFYTARNILTVCFCMIKYF